MKGRGEQPEGAGISEQAERRITIAIAVAFIALLPSLGLGWLLWHEIQTRTDANRALIVQVQQNEKAQETIRRQAREAIRRADIANCEADEVVKSRLRALLKFDVAEARQVLMQIGIDPDSSRGRALIERSRKSSAEAIHALRARDCSKLPDPNKPFARPDS